jgi:hypothetical protein
MNEKRPGLYLLLLVVSYLILGWSTYTRGYEEGAKDNHSYNLGYEHGKVGKHDAAN